MTTFRWLVAVAVGGAAILALSFVNGWIVHDMEIRGEGYRHAEILLSAWRSVAVPVLTLGAVAAGATALVALAQLRRPRALPAWSLPAGAVVALALIATSVVPLGWDGFTTSVDLRAGWLLPVGIGLAAAMTLAAVRAAGPGPRTLAAVGVLGVATFAVGLGGRALALELAGGNNEAWSDGVYLRAASDGRPAQSLTIESGRYTIGDRWAGSWEGSGGWTVVLDGDPACPESRGAYHAHDTGPSGEDLRFVKVVDTCLDGERAADLETGVWERQP